MRLCLAISLLLLSFNSYSAVRITGIPKSGYSHANNTDFSKITELWAVIPKEFPTEPQGSVFNSCAITPSSTFESCHEQAVYPDTVFTIEFLEDGEYTGSAKGLALIAADQQTESGSTVVSPKFLEDSSNEVSTNGTVAVSFTWGKVCQEIYGDSACTKSASFLLRIGIRQGSSETQLISQHEFRVNIYNLNDAPPTGSYGFNRVLIFPGDNGGFIDYADADDAAKTSVVGNSYTIVTERYPSAQSNLTVEMTDLSLFISTNPDQAFPYGAAGEGNVYHLPVADDFNSSSPTFKNDYFSGLNNGTPYYFRFATKDESGTISQLSTCTGISDCPSFVPAPIDGIITDSACFITTAAYGSPLAHKVQTFRDFRRKFMFNNKFGRFLVGKYNFYGPRGASWIRQNPWSKPAIRFFLYPLYLYSFLSLKLGIVFTTLGFIFTLLITLNFKRLFRWSTN